MFEDVATGIEAAKAARMKVVGLGCSEELFWLTMLLKAFAIWNFKAMDTFLNV